MNNDRFKFRVWNNKNNEYVPLGETCDLHCFLWRDGTLDCGISYDDGSAGGIDWVKTEDATIEQCTGLRDKNGKLIYEGDVLQAPGQTIAYKVQWAHHSFVMKTGFSSAKSYPLSSCEMFEIIGNIHEMELDK
jgi:uncharacterized phage protein (TIGR01671 family)